MRQFNSIHLATHHRVQLQQYFLSSLPTDQCHPNNNSDPVRILMPLREMVALLRLKPPTRETRTLACKCKTIASRSIFRTHDADRQTNPKALPKSRDTLELCKLQRTGTKLLTVADEGHQPHQLTIATPHVGLSHQRSTISESGEVEVRWNPRYRKSTGASVRPHPNPVPPGPPIPNPVPPPVPLPQPLPLPKPGSILCQPQL